MGLLMTHLLLGPLTAAAGDPCENGTAATCGRSPRFCEWACAWNQSHCISTWAYPMPANESLVALGAAGSPLTQDNLNIFFYGDSITWLNKFEPLIDAAIKSGPGTSKLQGVQLVNQGENGGTVLDIVNGTSPWGRLDFDWPDHGLNFSGSIHGLSCYGQPDIAGVMIGINDVWQGQNFPDPDSGVSSPGRGSNVSTFTRVLRDQVLKPAIAVGIRPYLVSVSVIGEKRSGENPTDKELDAFAAAQEQVATELKIPFVNVRKLYQEYDAQYNCLDLKEGVLTKDGVHPLDNGGRGGMMLANAHAKAILELLRTPPVIPSKHSNASWIPRAPPLPPHPDLPWGGRLFFTKLRTHVVTGVASADAACSSEAPAGVKAKAILVDEAGCGGLPCRRGSLTSSCTPATAHKGEMCTKVGHGDGQIDWPLKPSRLYSRVDNTTVGYTEPTGLFSMPLFWFVDPDWRNHNGHHNGMYNQPSGLDRDFTTRANLTCNSWSSRNLPPGAKMAVGSSNCPGTCLLRGGELPCPSTPRPVTGLFCVTVEGF